jgi:subtilisin family serine protease
MFAGRRAGVSKWLSVMLVTLLVHAYAGPVRSQVTAARSPLAGQMGGLQQSSPQDLIAKIAPEVLAETNEGQSASVVIFLADQADLSAAYEMKDQDARGWFVYRTLTEHAARTQADLQAFLKARGVSFQSYWAANMLIATADLALIETIAARTDVAHIDSNRPARWIEDPVVANFDAAAPDSPETVEWGVQNVNAPSVWAQGFTGQGIVIGDQDTGVRWTHAALKNHYRGWNGSTANHNYNWHDAIHSGGGSCGANTTAPCDDSGHGTHTTGTTSGDDNGTNQIGVAPGAKWIGCRNMDQGNGAPATYTECFQFMIAPTDLNGQNPNPSLRPHILTNSWTCPASEGCTTRAELETIVNNTQAAGIFVDVAAGNSGPACSTVEDPPSIYKASFSVGAIDINNTLASFSSRGPSTFYSPNLLKPNISAPGVNVRSAYNSSDTTYTNLSGTSMATPHVAGVVALLWSARPELVRDIATTKTILQNTANPNVTLSQAQTCGGIASSQIPNNSFGYGHVDALAAFNVPLLHFSAAAYSVGEGTATATITVKRTGGLSQAVTVHYATSNGTAIATKDYTAKSGTLSFAANETSKTFTVPIINDTLDEADETLKLTLSSPTGGAVLVKPSTATLKIVDNDAPPSLSINDVSVTEGNSGTTNAVFTVKLSAASGKTVTVHFATANGTAVAPGDYTAASGTLTFTAGQVSKPITVQIKGDTAVEPNETFKVNLSSAVNATISDASGVGTILNND